MKKILLIAADGFSESGVPTVYMNIVRNLSKEGYVFDIIYFDSDKDHFLNEFRSFGGKTILFDKQYKNIFLKKITRYVSGKRYYKKTLKVIKENGPYIAVHSFKEYMSSYFFKAAKKTKIPLRIYHCNIIVEISGNFLNKLLMTFEKKNCLKYMTNLIGCSSDACFSAFGSEFPFTVFNNPVNPDKFFYIESQKQNQTLTLVQTASFSDNKNQLFSLRVLKEILSKHQDARLNLIGFTSDPSYLAIMENFIKANNLEKHVYMYEHNADQRAIFSESDYFIFPSKKEGFGIVLIEAQACGLKCFVSDTVPTTTNVGGCVSLSLDSGPTAWAESILSDFNQGGNVKQKYDVSDFLNKNILSKYVSLYEGAENK